MVFTFEGKKPPNRPGSCKMNDNQARDTVGYTLGSLIIFDCAFGGGVEKMCSSKLDLNMVAIRNRADLYMQASRGSTGSVMRRTFQPQCTV